jgi:hypothetical protein
LLAGWKKHTAIKAKAIKSLKWKEDACWVEEAHGNQSKGYKILEVERGGRRRRRRAISAGPEDAQKGKDLASW